MELIDHEPEAIDLSTTPVHLGLGSRARPISGFAFDPSVLAEYGEAVADDGPEGRMVVLIDEEGAGDHWERHPGDELVVCVDGKVTVTRQLTDSTQQVVLGPGGATVNPGGVWHAVDAHGGARILTVTPGLGTEHRRR